MISETLMQKLNVQGLCDDSRRVKAKDLFFSMPGEKADEFARTALAPRFCPRQIAPYPRSIGCCWRPYSATRCRYW